MKVQKSKKGKFFLACTGYLTCQETALVDVDLVERYFYRHSGTGQHYTKCNCSLEAKVGQYGCISNAADLLATNTNWTKFNHSTDSW